MVAENYLASAHAGGQRHRRFGVAVGLAIGLIAGLGACGSGASSPSGASASAASSTLVATWPFPALDTDAAWTRAKERNDPLDLLSLAQREGAARLVAALDDPTWAETARRALPYADDREIALAPLAKRARAGASDARACLEALVEITRLPFPFGERLDPEGEARALGDLQAIAKDSARQEEERALADRVLRRMDDSARAVGASLPQE